MKKIYILLFSLLILFPVSSQAKEVTFPMKNKQGVVTSHLCGNKSMGMFVLLFEKSYIKKTNNNYYLYSKSWDGDFKIGKLTNLYIDSISDYLNQIGTQDYPTSFSEMGNIQGIKYYAFTHKGSYYIIYQKNNSFALFTKESDYPSEYVNMMVGSYEFQKKYFLKKPIIKKVKKNKNKIKIHVKKQKKANEYTVVFYNKKKKVIADYEYMITSNKNKFQFSKKEVPKAKYFAIITENDYRTSPVSKKRRLP